MTILLRAQQMAVFEKSAQAVFVAQTIEMLRRYSPRHFQVLEEGQIRNAVQQAWDRASAHGIAGEQGVRLFVYLSFQLGSQFDVDPQLSWVGRLRTESASAEEWIGRVYDAAVAYLDATAGLKGELQEQALIRIRKGLDLRKLAGREQSELALAEWLEELYPSKAAVMGKDGVGRAARAGIDKAATYGLDWPRGTAIYTALQFLLGSAFEADPLAPWAMAALSSSAAAEEKALRLERAAREKLDAWLS